MTVSQLPQVVAAGADAGFRVTITNNGPSNISALYLVSDLTVAPSFVGTPTQGTCNATGPLFCSFGALTATRSVTVTVAYTVGTSAFKIAFQGNTNGATFSDAKGRSRGDTLEPDPRVTTTGVASNQNFDAGFVVPSGDQVYETTGNLGRNNRQTSSVEVTDTLIPVTVQDGSGVTAPSCALAKCEGTFGEWTYLDVPGNNNLIKATLNIWGAAVPGGASTDQIYVIHVDDAGVPTVIDTPCSPTSGTPGNPECLTVTKIGGNYRIVVWLFGNGNLRGGF